MIDLAGVQERAALLAESIAGFRHRARHVTGWRLSYGEGRSARLGIHDSRVGSVYAPFELRDEVSGSFFIEWDDGKVSRGNVDGNSEGDLSLALTAACAARYRDDDARHFAGRLKAPSTPIYHPAVDRMVHGAAVPLYDTIDTIMACGRAMKVKRIGGRAWASAGVRIVRSSGGLNYVGRSTDTSFSFSFDATLWDWRGQRRPLRPNQVSGAIERVSGLWPLLNKKARRVASGRQKILCMPRFAESLIEAFVLRNLYGSAVVTGQSAFREKDFAERRRVLRRDFRLAVDPTVPYASGSYHITSDGLAARPSIYIDRGRLKRPIVGHKYAVRMGVKPSTPPSSMESVTLDGESVTVKRALKEMGDGLIVLGALGLHTQDAASGDYSLTAPQAIAVQGGEPVGSIKAVLAGNFLAALNADDTRLVRIPGYRFPALLLTCDVTT